MDQLNWNLITQMKEKFKWLSKNLFFCKILTFFEDKHLKLTFELTELKLIFILFKKQLINFYFWLYLFL